MRLWWQKSSSPQLRISLRHSLSLGLVACPTLSRVSISGCSVGTIANERDETHERERYKRWPPCLMPSCHSFFAPLNLVENGIRSPDIRNVVPIGVYDRHNWSDTW